MSPTVTPTRAGVAATTVTIASVIPVFLVGGLSVQISDDLGFTAAGLGAAVAANFAVSALVSTPSGRLVERYGAPVVARAAVLLSAGAMLGIAAAAWNYWSLVALLAVGATANSAGQLSSNLLLSRHIPRRRQGLLFGLKQAAIPASTLFAGVSVPLIALTVGWRWAFALAGSLALLALLPLRDMGTAEAPRARKREEQGRPTPALLVIGLAAACAASAASNLSPFLADTAVSHGLSPAAAGLTLTLGSGAGLCARVGFGWLTDRRGGDGMALIATMLVVGAGGLALLSATSLWTLPLGAVAGFGLGWAWPGILNFAVTHTHPQAPAAATGVTQTGVYLGGMLGPLTFGWVADGHGYSPAWLMSAGVMVFAGVLMLVGRRLLRSSVAARVGAGV
ncbi:MAG TPA: MFS transporter [Phytomonospora sp.]